MLTPRQEFILGKVVETYVAQGQPVASRSIAADPEVDCRPSTIRHELALLEDYGLLAHPHTSAGRVPTDAGHRYFVDRLLAGRKALVTAPAIQLTLIRHELDEAMRVTTETLSEVTNLLAIVSAPTVDSATIRHVEVLALQPSVVMVVIITSAGGVSKYVRSFDGSVDPGLIGWAGEYLNERLRGLALGARMLHQRIADPALGIHEQTFVERLAPAFRQLEGTPHDTLYYDGTSRLLGTHIFTDAGELGELMELLEERVALLAVLRRALGRRGVYVSIGRENDVPALQSLSLVAAGYGLARRELGTVSVIGPVRMDYGAAMATVRAAAHQLSSFVEDVYDGA
ncbi:MAG: heat-inducible transcriptional repressor [Solirubrobacteraceae bacterium]|jgi:heat-inducible transcriptional repressor|nr:heat-inducible transcriptional repressor [Solirubrobacteraceae bacterium]